MARKRHSFLKFWKSLLIITIVLYLWNSFCPRCHSSERKLYNLMKETCDTMWSITAASHGQGCSTEFANANRLQQDHPCVIELIRTSYLYQPAPTDAPLNLTLPEIIDTSTGNQSKIIQEYLKNQTQGFFVECGALDGEYGSNTLYMERSFNWKGILIEGNKKFFTEIMSKRRKAWVLPVCLSTEPYPTKVLFDANDEAGKIYSSVGYSESKPTNVKENISDWLIEVQCFPLYSILLAVGRTNVDYISLDVEGSESSILINIPWHLLDIKTLTVEITSRSEIDIQRLSSYMEENGYKMTKLLDGPGYFDVVFIKQDLV